MENNYTPQEAIRKFCVECFGSTHDTENCGGDKLLRNSQGKNGICYFYKYRQGHGAGRPSVKLIKKFCQECLGTKFNDVLMACSKKNCPIWPYRYGKLPKMVEAYRRSEKKWGIDDDNSTQNQNHSNGQ